MNNKKRPAPNPPLLTEAENTSASPSVNRVYAGKRQEFLDWMDGKQFPDGDTVSGPKIAAFLREQVIGRQNRRNPGTKVGLSTIYQYSGACSDLYLEQSRLRGNPNPHPRTDPQLQLLFQSLREGAGGVSDGMDGGTSSSGGGCGTSSGGGGGKRRRSSPPSHSPEQHASTTSSTSTSTDTKLNLDQRIMDRLDAMEQSMTRQLQALHETLRQHTAAQQHLLTALDRIFGGQVPLYLNVQNSGLRGLAQGSGPTSINNATTSHATTSDTTTNTRRQAFGYGIPRLSHGFDGAGNGSLE